MYYNLSGCGYNVATTDGSTAVDEMASLYYDTLGNLAYCDLASRCPQPGGGLINTGPFSNIQTDNFYWSATIVAGIPYTPYSPGFAWYFGIGGGYLSNANEANSL